MIKQKPELDKLAGKPVDISKWAYPWRADLDVQKTPESYFIPRRLERMDKVYRTAIKELPEQELKSIYYEMPELLEPLLPKPEGSLLAGLLWTGGLSDYQIELHWPGQQAIPPEHEIEVRVFPSAYGWFGWSKDRILKQPEISADNQTWTYKNDNVNEQVRALENGKWIYRSGSQTELVAVFYKGTNTKPKTKPIVPEIRVFSPEVGVWEKTDIEIEWNFLTGTDKLKFSGRVESYVAMIGSAVPLKSRGKTSRHGITVSLLSATGTCTALDSRVTVWFAGGKGVTFRICDLDKGPILVPDQGVFVTKSGTGKTGRQFAAELKAKNLKSVCQLVREHPEPESLEQVMREVRISTCPAGTVFKPFPKVEQPPVQVQLPDEGWTSAWRAGSFQLTGQHMWGGLAFEVGRVVHDMDMVGRHEQADKVYDHFLKSPGIKSDGDFVDGDGSLEWATGIRHDMGYNHDGTHASTGRLLFAMSDRYFLTGDKKWFEQRRPRLQKAADWIIRQRKLYLKDVTGRDKLFVAGLMPPCMIGDYAIPSCDWHWYYVSNAYDLQGLQRFADVLMELDPKTGRKYLKEAKSFRKDLARVIDKETVLSPVRPGRDGMYHSYIPESAYARGTILSLELLSLQRSQYATLIGSLPLAEPFVLLDAADPRMVGTLNMIEEIGTVSKVSEYLLSGALGKHLNEIEGTAASVTGLEKLSDRWFWNCYGASIPKASHNANIYLLQDDVQNFLRFWSNSYVAMVAADGQMWEWGQLGRYADCTAPDNGTAGWFMECFRNLLMMEDGSSLWLARATPRAWLKQGKKISVNNAPTYFGTLAYEIVSDVDNGRITATIEIPGRNPASKIILRLRHPGSVPIKSVTVNGKPWSRFNKEKETIELKGFKGKVVVNANY
jgi:hypothetical protein